MSNPNHTILLVEDDPNDVLLLKRAFEKGGITAELHIVGDGEEAVCYLAGKGAYGDRAVNPLPQLVLLDVKLPRRSGIEVLEWIRKQASFQGLPVIMLTSSRQAVNMRKAYELGANSYLIKPVGFEKLLEMVRSIEEYWLNWNADPATAL